MHSRIGNILHHHAEKFLTVGYVASSFGLCQALLAPSAAANLISSAIFKSKTRNLLKSKHYEKKFIDDFIKKCKVQHLSNLNSIENKKLGKWIDRRNLILFIFYANVLGSAPVIGPLKGLAYLNLGPLKPKKQINKNKL